MDWAEESLLVFGGPSLQVQLWQEGHDWVSSLLLLLLGRRWMPGDPTFSMKCIGGMRRVKMCCYSEYFQGHTSALKSESSWWGGGISLWCIGRTGGTETSSPIWTVSRLQPTKGSPCNMGTWMEVDAQRRATCIRHQSSSTVLQRGPEGWLKTMLTIKPRGTPCST